MSVKDVASQVAGTDELTVLRQQIVDCNDCPRLREWCLDVAAKKRPLYATETYWGRPVPGFGDPQARLILLGLAPGAHGANRTGRVFTGDKSGEWLYEALHRFGFANQPHSTGHGDGLELHDAYISNIVRCAPPKNLPTTEEIKTCARHLQAEFQGLVHNKVVLALGEKAFKQYLQVLKSAGHNVGSLKFAHGQVYRIGEDTPVIVASYHPSFQNTNTGKLTREMWYGVFEKVRRLLEEKNGDKKDAL